MERSKLNVNNWLFVIKLSHHAHFYFTYFLRLRLLFRLYAWEIYDEHFHELFMDEILCIKQ